MHVTLIYIKYMQKKKNIDNQLLNINKAISILNKDLEKIKVYYKIKGIF